MAADGKNPGGAIDEKLLVTNSPVTASAADEVAQTARRAPVRLISWRGEVDNLVLRESLAELFNSIPSTGNG